MQDYPDPTNSQICYQKHCVHHQKTLVQLGSIVQDSKPEKPDLQWHPVLYCAYESQDHQEHDQ